MTGPNAEDGYGYTEQTRADVMATLLAHGDRGDGYCDECHELDPCGVRLHHESVLNRLNRQLGRR
jgi:hypothetical protein